MSRLSREAVASALAIFNNERAERKKVDRQIDRRLAGPSERLRGTVKWFDVERGYGWINRDDGRSVFVHGSALKAAGIDKADFAGPVEFEVALNDRGECAEMLRLLPDDGARQHRGRVRQWRDDRGFGFIAPDAGGEDVFAHRKDVGDLIEGARVEFDVGDWRDGRPRAIRLRRVIGR